MTEGERLRSLGRAVAGELDRAPVSLNPARRGFLDNVDDVMALREGRRRVAERVRSFGWVGAAAVALLGAGAAYLHFLTERPLGFVIEGQGGQPQVGEWLAAPAEESLALTFSDGSRFELAPSARGRVLEVDAQGSHVMLERGAASVRVTKRPDAHWRFSAGPFVVEVLGTEFDLVWDPEGDEFVLRLEEGRVNVSGCNFREGRPVLPGETVRASCAARRFEVVSTAAVELEAAPPPTPQAEVRAEELVAAPGAPHVARESQRPTAKPAGWREMARDGRYAEALSLVEADGFDAVLREASAADLALLGDAARLTGRSDRALGAYQAVRQRFAGTKAASNAAFHVARIYFDQLGAYARAAAWFETYLTEQPQGGLAREATGRWLESLQRSGNPSGARKVAARYLERYPQGPHAGLARQVLAAP
jgi:TolA-binding protein